MRKNIEILRVIGYLILGIACIVTITPLIIIFQKAVSIEGLNSFIIVINSTNILRNFFNSCFVTFISVVLVVVVVSLAAFSFSKLNFRFKNAIFLVLLSALMIPGATVAFPVFLIVKNLGITDNYLALIGPYTALLVPFNLLIMKNFYDDIPKELSEAAYIDGSGTFKTLVYILFPLTKPAVIVITVWSFLVCWNDFFWAMLFLSSKDMLTITLLPSKFTSLYRARYDLIFASLIIIILPVLILYAFAQKYFEKGLIAGSIKQ